MYITLKEARKHLELDDFFHEDDEQIIQFIKAAEDVVARRADRPIKDLLDPATGELRPSTKQSILLLIGTFYNQREATTTMNVKPVPLAFDFLADLDKRPSVG